MGQSLGRKCIQEFNPGDCQFLPGIEVRYFHPKRNKWYRSFHANFDTNLKFMNWVIEMFGNDQTISDNSFFSLFYLDTIEESESEWLNDLNWRSLNLLQKFNPNLQTYLITDKDDFRLQVEVRYTP